MKQKKIPAVVEEIKHYHVSSHFIIYSQLTSHLNFKFSLEMKKPVVVIVIVIIIIMGRY